MQSSLAIVALPHRHSDLEALLGQSSIKLALAENNLPKLCVQGHSLSAESGHTASAGFSMIQYPHILLADEFFREPHECQLFILMHELRRAHQSLVNDEGKRYVGRRRLLLEAIQPTSVHDASKFLSAALEYDAQEYALTRMPYVGSGVVLRRVRYVHNFFDTYSQRDANTLAACNEILPAVYQWERLVDKEILLADHVRLVRKYSAALLDFLRTHTLAGQDEKIRSLCREYLKVGSDDFLRVAKDLYVHLLTLSN